MITTKPELLQRPIFVSLQTNFLFNNFDYFSLLQVVFKAITVVAIVAVKPNL